MAERAGAAGGGGGTGSADECESSPRERVPLRRPGARGVRPGARGTGHGARGVRPGARGAGPGARGAGHGARGTGPGARGAGHGARGTGPGARGAGLYTEPLKDAAPVVPDYAKDWKRVAEIVDRLFFWLFLLAITLSTLVLLHPLMTLLAKGEKQTGARALRKP